MFCYTLIKPFADKPLHKILQQLISKFANKLIEQKPYFQPKYRYPQV